MSLVSPSVLLTEKAKDKSNKRDSDGVGVSKRLFLACPVDTSRGLSDTFGKGKRS